MYPRPEFKILKEKFLIGKCLKMCLAVNHTADLWKSFMPVRDTIINPLSKDLFSVQVYSATYFDNFNPNVEFEKWALMEVSDFNSIPEGMESFTLKGGFYAVFHYTGSSIDNRIFDYIFNIWLPESGYSLDTRPHFQVLGGNYKNADPKSEEELWIPVKPK